MEDSRSSFKILTGKPTGIKSLGRPICRMDLKKVGINTRYWVDLAQDRDYSRALVNVALYLRIQ